MLGDEFEGSDRILIRDAAIFFDESRALLLISNCDFHVWLIPLPSGEDVNMGWLMVISIDIYSELGVVIDFRYSVLIFIAR